ncbi:GH36-type glycosyl hydrolase domain-containing protein [Novosphingobium album (ex Liu et al. 2023)]|uniref:Glucoamylase family protein n=1 Tax=Novosphingobium album (ex Liu et al. 2023) TaxID=3031130 RepID=A0ABT5WUV2_9SPHN|nr:glucoamylase family protein [Novosphingobium album (ex Liu et al. 2023)]MDE8653686.1 glucoamylase family protein [Novosphingobium album (ex Liu et al. 2023)]
MDYGASDPVAGHAWETGKAHAPLRGAGPPRPIAIWQRIERIGQWLRDALDAAAVAEPSAATAAEWLLDNGYQVQRAALLIKQDLPPGFYRKLCVLASASAPREPRVLALAHDLLHATHFQLSRESVLAYLEGYQEHDPLDIAELWALPAMLRIACIERLVAGFAEVFPTVPAPLEVSTCCEAYLTSCEPIECVSRAIANLGVISNISWKDVFDASSHVERSLRRDPAGTYPAMDFDTRDAYRRAVERLAERSAASEVLVAQSAVSLATKSRNMPLGHVGYWLVGPGALELERTLGAVPPRALRLARWLKRHPGGAYTWALFLCGLAGLVLPGAYLAAHHAAPMQWLLGLALSALPATVLSVTLVNWLVTLAVPPRRLAKLDFSKGIDAAWPTLVVMPVIVGEVEEAPALLARLEAHRLANPDARAFVLLSDPADAREERTAGDERLEAALCQGIEALNHRHGARAGQPSFCLLHRARSFNPAQDCWMAWERKRGKLEQFNHFLLSGEATAFPVTSGPIGQLAGARLVVTADADTRLPPGSVARLAGALAHPLNRPVFDASGRVVSGYTVLQPRVEIAPHGSDSLFARLFGGDTAIDIYSRAVSDVYQDLVGTGNFVGKGIYDVAGFARSVQGRIPENYLLSHDLWEGLHGRAGLASDIIVYESFPASYGEYARRWHRWVRGDWQLLPWLFGRVPGPDGTRLKNRLTLFDRLRIWDNMRRSLVPASVLVLLLGGWFILPGQALFWTLLALLVPGAWLFTDLVTGLARGRRRGVLTGTLNQAGEHLGRWTLQIAFLLSDTAIALHAIGITMLRMRRRRHLLEWTSAAHVSRKFAGADRRGGQWRETWPSPLAALLMLSLFAFDPRALPVAAPLMCLWLAAPAIAAWTGRARTPPPAQLDAAARAFLRRVARRSWLFFETYVRPEDNWLPPDNHQEEPVEATAHRTSPTNIGMMVLSALSAWRLGHIGSAELNERMRAMFASLDRLERWQGHFLNWYDTTSLASLEPRYVSTVDSGNLAVSLVVLAEGCRRIARSPAFASERWDGLDDCLAVLAEALAEGGYEDGVQARIAALTAEMRAARAEPLRWPALLDHGLSEIAILRDELARLLDRSPARSSRVLRNLRNWIERSEHQFKDCRRDLETLLPWLPGLAAAPPECRAMALRLAATLSPLEPLCGCARLARAAEALRAELDGDAHDAVARAWLADMAASARRGLARWRRLERSLERLADHAAAMAEGMEFGPLYDPDRKLFHIGYDVSTQRIDSHFYDLLASEARLASYFAIAKQDVPPEHWFHLGRPIVKHRHELALVSWNGSMFEYLMPALFLRSDPATLLGESERSAVASQRRYGARQGVPWGISESGFASVGADGSWRYRAFGVPELGLRRGLTEDLVIAPYATALALAADPAASVANLRRLVGVGATGCFGFYEALDFTPERRREQGVPTPVQSFMAHHQGMTIAAIANALCGNMLVDWFHADARVRTVDLLLNERIPWELPPELERLDHVAAPAIDSAGLPRPQPWEVDDPASLAIHLLGNGRLSARIAADGADDLSWKDQALTRPAGADHDIGHFFYLREPGTGLAWSPAPAPLGGGEDRHTIFHAHKIEYRCGVQGISTSLEVLVSPSEDVEIRRLRLVNTSAEQRILEFASHAEIALAPAGEWQRHPAFARLFVEAGTYPELDALLFARRPREPGALAPVLMQRLVTSDDAVRLTGWEVARARSRARLGLTRDFPRFSGPAGPRARFPLDPAAAFQAEVTLAPHGEVELALVTTVAASREEAIELARRYGSMGSLDWAEQDAAERAARDLHALGLAPARLPDAQLLLTALIGCPSPRNPGLGDNDREDLWALGLSGDCPLLLMELSGDFDGAELRFLLAAHRLWGWRGAAIDLVLLHPGLPGYVEPLRERMLDIVRQTGSEYLVGERGGVHIVGSEHVEERRLAALRIAATATIADRAGPIAQQLAARRDEFAPGPPFLPAGRAAMTQAATRPPDRAETLRFANGLGSFTRAGDYRIALEAMRATPAPWANVLANPGFGSIVTEAGLGFTFAGNSGENRLTPWHNDALSDRQGEALYLRDEETGEVWSVTPLPAGRDAACRIEHGLGGTRWWRDDRDLDQELHCFVARDDPVKIVRLRLTDRSGLSRRVTATCFVDWLLGAIAGEPAPFRASWYRTDLQTIFARNRWQRDFHGQIAFLSASGAPHSLTTSRRDFLGPRPDWQRPAGLAAWDLGNRTENAGADAAAALQLHLDIPAHGSAEVAFLLGQAEGEDGVADLIARWRDSGRIAAEPARLAEAWERRCDAVEVTTPDPAFDLMVNRWLPYQTVSSRLFARAGFHQASGAFGFRDQLQDVLALLLADPALARDQILRAAAHQFAQGDVLHWWHPPGGKGVRTRCSDDLLWLPHAAARYVVATGDVALLDEPVPFLDAAELRDDERDRFAQFPTADGASLFEHCLRAFDRAWRLGEHGLPLIGDGDWNDGMNRVGSGGKGESVWLGWFMAATIREFARMCDGLGRGSFTGHWLPRADQLVAAIERHGWDGDWYVRAFDDQGRPWGSRDNDECRIDSLAQSWSVIAGGGTDERARRAIDSAFAHLVRPDDRIVRLLDPPFDTSPRDPGYIKAYPPGIRENGGQYSHASAWLGIACAMLGDGARAKEVFDRINPIRHAGSSGEAAIYGIEPYVVAGDIGAGEDRLGRGGWSWYTGAAAWTWRLAVEHILGLRLEGGQLALSPCLPPDWPGFTAKLRGAGVIEVTVKRGPGTGLRVDGASDAGSTFAFPGKGRTRKVELMMAESCPVGEASPV